MKLTEATREPKRKIARARKLFQEAEADLDSWTLANRTVARLAPHGSRMRIDIVVETATEPPLDAIALTVGDAVHNLRSALDNLAWTMANLPGPPKNPKSIYFPVCEKVSAWDRATKDLASIPSSILERIRTLQPFMFPRNEECFLWQLHKLDIADKHRSYLSAQAQWQWSDVDGLVLEVDADTTIQTLATNPRLSTMSNQVIGSIKLSKPYHNEISIGTTVSVDTLFVVSYERDGPAFSVGDMAKSFPAIVDGMIDLVCLGEVGPDQITEERHFIGP